MVPADHARLACVPRSPPDSGFQAVSRQIIGRMASQNSNDSSGSSDLLNRLKGLVTDKIGIALVLALVAAGAVAYVVVF